MNQLEFFLDALHGENITASCNWQIKQGAGHLQQYTIHNENGHMLVIFQTYGRDRGFSTYIETETVKFADDIATIQKRLNG